MGCLFEFSHNLFNRMNLYYFKVKHTWITKRKSPTSYEFMDYTPSFPPNHDAFAFPCEILLGDWGRPLGAKEYDTAPHGSSQC